MARQLRIEYEHGLYHVTARGNERRNIYVEDGDNERFLEYLANVINRFQWLCHGYCLMSNHYHLLVETPLANLSAGMKLLNGRYAQYFNRRMAGWGISFRVVIKV